jgi:hypothetical protein
MMSPLVRNALAVVAGGIVGIAVIMVAQYLNSTMFPPPAGIDYSSAEGMARAVAQMPTGAFVGLIVGYLLGTTAGVYAGVRVAASNHALVAWLVAAIFVAGGLSNFMMIPHPTWVFALSLLAFAAAPMLGLRLAGRATR